MKRVARLTASAWWLAAPAAFAHAVLVSAVPPAGANVATPPASVSLVFSEALELQYSSVAVTDEAGVRVDRDKPAPAAEMRTKTLTIALHPLPPGKYKVTWHATSVDTHKSQGNYTFAVSP